MITYFPCLKHQLTCWLLSYNMENRCLKHSAPEQNKNINKHRQGPIINKNKQCKNQHSCLPVYRQKNTSQHRLLLLASIASLFNFLHSLIFLPSTIHIQTVFLPLRHAFQEYSPPLSNLSPPAQTSCASLSHSILLSCLLSVYAVFLRPERLRINLSHGPYDICVCECEKAGVKAQELPPFYHT